MADILINSTQVMYRNGVWDNNTKLHYSNCTVTGGTDNIPTIGTFVLSAEWMVPITVLGQFQGFQLLDATGQSVPPTPGCWKILNLKNERQQWAVAIANTDEIGGNSQWGTYANGLGGSLPSMPIVALPFPVIQSKPIPPPAGTVTTGNVFYFTFPLNPQGLGYNIQCVWFNGVAPVTPFVPGSITTPAAFVTWANANWGSYGTWSSNGLTVILASPSTAVTPVTLAGLNAQLVPATYCLSLTSFLIGQNVNGIGFGSAPVNAFGAFQLTGSYASLQQLVTAIKPFFDTGATFTILASGSTAKIQITTRLAAPVIYNNTTPIAGATLGGCV